MALRWIARPYQGRPFGSTMRISGTFCRLEQFGGPKERPQTHGVARESVRSTLLPIHHADRDSALQTGRSERLDGLDRGPAGRHHVLDQADPLPWLESALQPVLGAVLLRLLADDQERQ